MPADLSGKSIKFVGENAIVHKTDDVSPYTGENYIFKGVTSAVSMENIYTLNENGNSFVLGNDCGAFRAYFKPVTFNPAVTTLSIVNEGATSVADVKQQQKDGKTDVYDLQGRKITNSQQSKASGIYISNGKKVIIL